MCQKYRVKLLKSNVRLALRRRHAVSRRRHVLPRRRLVSQRRRGAPLGPQYRFSKNCRAFPRRCCVFSWRKCVILQRRCMFLRKRSLPVTEQQQYFTQKLDFHGILTHLYAEVLYFHAKALALTGHVVIVDFNFKGNNLQFILRIFHLADVHVRMHNNLVYKIHSERFIIFTKNSHTQTYVHDEYTLRFYFHEHPACFECERNLPF